MSLTLTSPHAAVAAAPYLVGFRPADSLVLLLCDDHELRATVRLDLPDRPDVDWLMSILDAMGDPVPDAVLLILYADDAPLELVEGLGGWLATTLHPIVEVLDCSSVHDGMVRSLRPDVDEVPLDSLANHPIVAECVAAGMSFVASREDLAAMLDFVDDGVSDEVAALIAEIRPEPYDQWRDRAEEGTLDLLTSTEHLSAADVVLLGRACKDIFVRDPLLAVLLDPTSAHEIRQHARSRLGYAAIHLPDEYAAGVAATTALLCWALGDWAAASMAADRAILADPRNTLAPLVLDAMDRGLPGETWGLLTRDIPMEVLRGRARRIA